MNNSHLTFEEILEFITFDEINEETLALAGRVTAHIVECDECRENIRAYQTIYDEFVKLANNKNGDFRKYLAEKIKTENQYDVL